MRWVSGALCVALLLSGCGSESSSAGAAGCSEPAEKPSPDPIDVRLKPATVSPGDHFTATFPSAKGVDELLLLSVTTDEGCVRTFYSAASTKPRWGEITSKRASLIGLDVPGRVVPGIVPPIAPAGTYQVCGGPMGTTCGTLVVTD